MEKTICELFAGVGGFRLGFERQSEEWKTVWFSQWEPDAKKQWAHECYVSHWGDIDENTGKDIGTVNKADIPDHNILVGGFPCQDYSVARTLSGNHGIEGKKGVLWWQIRDTLHEKKAPFALFENVDRLLKSPASQRGRDFGIMLYCLNDLGYSVEWRVVNAADYGAAQRRRRTFIFAYKNETKYGQEKADVKAEEIFKSEGMFAKAFPIHKEISVSSTSLPNQPIEDVSETFSYNFENSGYMTNGTIYTAATKPIVETPTTIRQIAESNVDEKYYISEEDIPKWQYLKGAKKIERTSKTGHEYTFSEGPIAFPDDLDKPARTMLTSEATKNRSSHVIADPGTNRLRLITPLEAERIQGYGDNWTATMPDVNRYFCMGNALVVPMITRMARQISTIFDNE